MITLKENEFKKISEDSWLCYCQIWGCNKFMYMLVINSSEHCADWGYTIYGWGETSEEAMLMGIKNLVDCSLKAIPISYLLEKDTSFVRILERIESGKGMIEDPLEKIKADLSEIEEERKQFMGTNPSFDIIFEDGKCYPLMS